MVKRISTIEYLQYLGLVAEISDDEDVKAAYEYA
jgi:hypothetical protein